MRIRPVNAMRFAALAVLLFLSIAVPRPAAAQWVVTDPIMTAMQQMEWMSLNGLVSNLHSDIRLLMTGMKKLMNGNGQATTDAIDRLNTVPAVAQAAAAAVIPPTSTACSTTYAGAARNDAGGIKGVNSIQQMVAAAHTQTQGNSTATATSSLADGCGAGWSFYPSETSSPCKQQ